MGRQEMNKIERPADIHNVCDYIITRSCENQERVTLVKVHKLLYYSQAWFLALRGKPLFRGNFEAWMH